MSEVIKNGSVLLDSLETLEKGFRYGYEWENNGVKLRLVVDDLNDGNKIFDFYSDRNFIDFRDARPQPSTSKSNGTQPITLNEEILPQKDLTSQGDLLKKQENLNTITQETQILSPLERANAEKLLKIEHAITPLKEFGKNYPEFALKPKEALEKLLQERNGQVAGASYRDDLGYGLAHVLERREQQALTDGLSEAEAKDYALNVVKSIPEIIEKGEKGTDHLGRVFVDYGNKRVGLNNTWNNKGLDNHWVVSGYELKNTTEKPTHFPTPQAITKERDLLSLNSVEPNLIQKELKSQEILSNLEQANAEKLLKLESERLQSEQEFLKAKEQEIKRKEALKRKLEHERGNAGNIESNTKIEVGADIPTQIQEQLPKSRVRLNEREIYDLDYAVVKEKDLKPNDENKLMLKTTNK